MQSDRAALQLGTRIPGNGNLGRDAPKYRAHHLAAVCSRAYHLMDVPGVGKTTLALNLTDKGSRGSADAVR